MDSTSDFTFDNNLDSRFFTFNFISRASIFITALFFFTLHIPAIANNGNNFDDLSFDLKLKQLKKAFSQKLITSNEYNTSRKKIISNFINKKPDLQKNGKSYENKNNIDNNKNKTDNSSCDTDDSKSNTEISSIYDCSVFIMEGISNSKYSTKKFFSFIKKNINAVTEGKFVKPIIGKLNSKDFNSAMKSSDTVIHSKNINQPSNVNALIFIKLNSFQLFVEHSHKFETDYSSICRALVNVEYCIYKKRGSSFYFNKKGSYRKRITSSLSIDLFENKIIGSIAMKILNLFN